MRAALLLGLLLLPTAVAGVPFEVDLADPRGDTFDGNVDPVDVPAADILRVTSRVVDGKVLQRIEMAVAPTEDDSILVRNWYDNSTNGSWHVIELAVYSDEPDPSARFRAQRREGDFFNATPIVAKAGIDGTSWTFEFDASLVANARCFNPGILAEHKPARGLHGRDAAYLGIRKPCNTAGEPKQPGSPIEVRTPAREGAAEPTQDAPGSQAPTPALPIAGIAVALAAATIVRRRRAP